MSLGSGTLGSMASTSPGQSVEQVVLRDATIADARALAGFAERVFRETYEPTCRAEDIDAYVADSFGPEVQRSEIRDPEVRTILATLGGELVGYVQLRRTEPPPCLPEAPAIEIGRFYVDHSWHGTGVAQALMNATLDAVPSGTKILWLGVLDRNRRAVRFYTRMGFRIVGVRRFAMGAELQDDWIMMREAASDGRPTGEPGPPPGAVNSRKPDGGCMDTRSRPF